MGDGGSSHHVKDDRGQLKAPSLHLGIFFPCGEETLTNVAARAHCFWAVAPFFGWLVVVGKEEEVNTMVIKLDLDLSLLLRSLCPEIHSSLF